MQQVVFFVLDEAYVYNENGGGIFQELYILTMIQKGW